VRRLALLIGAAAALAVAVPAVAQDSPVETSREASRWLAFEGVVRVEWIDGEDRRAERVTVRSWDGTMTVKGALELTASERARFVYQRGLGWAMVWPDEQRIDERPSPTAKYRIVRRGEGPTIAGRGTEAVEVRRRRDVWERVYLDADTGLALRREQFDARGHPRRIVTFESIAMGTTPVPVPLAAEDQTPPTVARKRPAAPYRAPAALGSGYRLVGAYRQDGGVHLLYSDGVYDLSVFEQRGRLAGDGLPAGRRRVELAGGRDGWRVAWPGGEIVMWQAGGAVFTAVGEGPFTDVLAAVRTMPRAGNPSLVEKLRRVCRSFLDGFR
jgi:hypothetical protein